MSLKVCTVLLLIMLTQGMPVYYRGHNNMSRGGRNVKWREWRKTTMRKVTAGPPVYVRSAIFENSLRSMVMVKVTFKSKTRDGRHKTKYYAVGAGKSVNVKGIIDRGTYSLVDPITSFKVISVFNGEKKVLVKSSTGVEIHRYTIRVGRANRLKITKILI